MLYICISNKAITSKTNNMKNSTLLDRIKKSNNVNGKEPQNSDYTQALEVLKGAVVYTTYTIGSGKYTRVSELTPEKYLQDWGIDFEKDNDAPRGGKSGNFIKLSKKGLQQTLEYRLEITRQDEINRENQKQKWIGEAIDLERLENSIVNNIVEDKDFFKLGLLELEKLKTNEDKENWQITANSLVQKACKNDFSYGWKNTYNLIKSVFNQ